MDGRRQDGHSLVGVLWCLHLARLHNCNADKATGNFDTLAAGKR